MTALVDSLPHTEVEASYAISLASARNNATSATALVEVYNQIVSGDLAAQIAEIRAVDKQTATDLKKRLPAFIVSGNFTKRNRDSWQSASGLMVLDFDDVADPDGLRCVLSGKSCVALAFISPSGKGCKAVIRVPVTTPDEDLHKHCFQAACRWAEAFGAVLDPSGKDPARLCYLSSDPEAYFNPSAAALDLEQWAEPITASITDQRQNTRINSSLSSSEKERRALKYIQTITSVDKQKGSPALMQVLRYLHDGFAFDQSAVMRVAGDWNATNAHPPWDACDIDKKLEDVQREPSIKGRGWLLKDKLSGRVDNDVDAVPVEPRKGLTLRTAADRQHQAQNPPEMIVEELVPAGGLCAFVAPPGIGKTLQAIALAADIAVGGTFAGRACKKGRVIYACTDSQRSTENRLAALPDEVAEQIFTVGEMVLPRDIALLDEAATVLGDVALIVVDTWDSTRSHSGDSWSGQDAMLEGIMRGLRTLAENHHLGVLILHHSTRADAGRARGSVVFDARADWIAVVSAEGMSGLCLTSTKSRDGQCGVVGRWQIEGVDLHGRSVPVARYVGQGAPAKTAGVDRGRVVLNYLGEPGKHSVRSIAEGTGLPQTAVQRTLDELRVDGSVEKGVCCLTAAGRHALYDSEIEGFA